MKQVFAEQGKDWNNIGKENTDLNYMLSSPTFRHQDDPNIKKFQAQINLCNKISNDDLCALSRIISLNQVNDESLFDLSKLLLLGVLYCKGSRIGKSNLLYPLITQKLNICGDVGLDIVENEDQNKVTPALLLPNVAYENEQKQKVEPKCKRRKIFKNTVQQ